MTNFDYMRQLLDRIGDLEQKLKEANKRIDREIDVAQRYDAALTEHLRQHGRELIIKGKSRSGPAALAAHLGNAEKNERITLFEVRGTVAKDLRGALVEMDAYAAGSRCEQPLYHAAISPAPPHRLTSEQIIESVDALEKELGLQGHPRLIVLHEKNGRAHIHPVWARIDLNTMKAVSDSHNYRKHEIVARELERRFGHERVQGAHHERDGVTRPDRTPSRAELRQEERTGIKGRNVKAEVTGLFRASDNAEAFRAALKDAGYVLALGDRRDFVIVDRKGGIHSLARRIDGVNTAQLREFMTTIDRETLPAAKDVRHSARELERLRNAARAEAKLEGAYSRSDDYVTQSQAATRDFRDRQKKLNREIGRDSLWDRIEKGEQAREAQSTSREDSSEHNEENVSEARKRRMKRLTEFEAKARDESQPRDDGPPDRQHETPSGGRSRGR